LQTQLVIAKRLRLGDSAKLLIAEDLSIEIGKMLGGLAAYPTTEVNANRSTPPSDN
jgi:hypothetical protein